MPLLGRDIRVIEYYTLSFGVILRHLHLSSDMRTLLFLIHFSLLLSVSALSQGFIQNEGQWKAPFLYQIDIPSGAAFIETNSITFHLIDRSGLYGPHGTSLKEEADSIEHHHAFRFRFLGANKDIELAGSDPLSHYVNFYLGKDPARWKTGLKPFSVVEFTEIYDGIDLKVNARGEHLKYEFHVAPGSEYRDIRIKIEGAEGLSLDRHGNLIISTTLASIQESKPLVYQEKGNKRWEVPAEFILSGNTVSYSIMDFDSNLALIIDPELIFSTFSGSTADNWGYTATPDKDGNLYAGSGTVYAGYPVTLGAYDVSFNGDSASTPADITISKFNAAGTQLIYSTYLGGESREIPHSLIVDSDNNLFVLGTTDSDDFPTTTNAADQTFNGGPSITNLSFSVPYVNGADMIVAKFNASGSALLGSTYLGGNGTDGLNRNNVLAYNYSDEARGEIILDNEGNVVIVSATTSNDFPAVHLGYQTTKSSGQDGVVSKLNSTLTSILWSTYLGGNGSDAAYGVAIARDNTIYVTGGTNSTNFPTHVGAFQGSNAGGRSDAFISHLNQNGTTLLHSTYFGTNAYDQMFLIQLDGNDHPHVFGQTEHKGSDYIFGAAFNDVGGGQVIANFRPDLESRVWSTQFGSTPGKPNISPTSFLVDVCNSVYLAGWGGNVQAYGNNNASDVSGLPVTNDAIKSVEDFSGSEFYLCVLDADANTQTYGSFFGGDQSTSSGGEHVDGGTSRFDRSGKIYQAVCAGCPGTNSFPIEPDPGAWSEVNGSGNCNLGVFKIDFDLPIILADFDAPNFGCAPFTVNFDNNSLTQNSTTFYWNFGNGNVSTQTNPTVTYTQSGNYIVQLIVSDPNSCNLKDTLTHTIVVKKDTAYTIPLIDTCVGIPFKIGPNPADFDFLSNANISWSPSQFLDDASLLNPTATVKKNTTFVLTIDYGGCSEVITQSIVVDRFPIETANDTLVCSTFAPFEIWGEAPGSNTTYEWSLDGEFSSILSTDSVITISKVEKAITSFYFRATKPNGCAMLDTVDVTIIDWDLALTNDTAICQDEDARIEAVSKNPLNTFTFYWSLTFGDTVNLLTDKSSNFLIINETEPTTYHLYAVSNIDKGCFVFDSTHIQVSTLNKNAVTATAAKDSFYLGEKVQLTGSPASGYLQSWSPALFLNDSSIYNPIAHAKKAMVYTYTVTDPDITVCSFSDSVYIYPYEVICGEPEVFLPTAFTPNLDGLNDALYLRGKNIKTVELSIYDRWGKLMFNTDDQSIGWDGKHKGQLCEPGVYMFYYEASCIDEQRIFRKGNITLIAQ